jgi:hypothetical protein
MYACKLVKAHVRLCLQIYNAYTPSKEKKNINFEFIILE